MKNTPSISDLDIRKMIGKYPVDQVTVAKKGEKEKTVEIIAKINEELNSGNTSRYCNYINMGMMNEKYAIDQTLMTASILKEIDVSEQKQLKKAYNFRLVDMLEVQE